MAAEGSLITELERRLRVSEQVIKFITVRMDEEEKRLAKVKAIRDTQGEAQRAAGTGCRHRGTRGAGSRTRRTLRQVAETRRPRHRPEGDVVPLLKGGELEASAAEVCGISARDGVARADSRATCGYDVTR